jgi:hypothetical protein
VKVAQAPRASSWTRYKLQVERDREGRVEALELTRSSDGTERALRLNGLKATLLAGPIYEVTRAGGVPPRAWASGKPIELSYLAGAQLELLLKAVRPLRRLNKVEQVAEGIARMSFEEASYWHAKMSRPGGLPALRLLLSATSH